jgi:DNA end-binding protein Ku
MITLQYGPGPHGTAAIAKFVRHGRERLGLLRAKDDVIALHALKWPDEIRSPDSLAPPATEVSDDGRACDAADRLHDPGR